MSSVDELTTKALADAWDDEPRYGLMCWECRSFHQRLRPVGQAWLCNYCAFKHRASDGGRA